MAEQSAETLFPQEEQTTEITELTQIRMTPEELYQLRTRLAGMRGSQKLQTILNADNPRQLVNSMPPQEFLYTIKEIGMTDSAELLELATKELVSYCLDLDLWKKDRMQHEKLNSWLKFLEAGEIPAAEKVLTALDSDLLVLYFRSLLKIHIHIEDEVEPVIDTVGDLIMTPDRNYIIEIPFPPDDPQTPMVQAAVKLFLEYGYEFIHPLFEAMRHGLDSDLEERAYQIRKGRAEELGFVDYFDAIGIYQPLRPKTAPLPPTEPQELSPLLPILVPPRGTGLFHQAMQQIVDPQTRERVLAELLFLNNKVLSADQIDLSQRKAAERSLRTVLRTLDLGLETLAGDDPKAASEILAKHHVEWAFRNGFSALARLRRKANALVRDERLTLLKEAPLSLLGSPYVELVQELRQMKPRYVSALDDPPGRGMRPFRRLQDIQRAEAALATASMLSDLFFRDFNFSHEQLVQWALSDALISPTHLEDLHHSHLFLTALAHFVLSEEFVLRPITAQEIQKFLGLIFEPQEELPHRLAPGFQTKVEELLLQRPGTLASETQHLQVFLRNVWETLVEEASYLPLDQTPEPRFLNLFLVVRPDSSVTP